MLKCIKKFSKISFCDSDGDTQISIHDEPPLPGKLRKYLSQLQQEENHFSKSGRL